MTDRGQAVVSVPGEGFLIAGYTSSFGAGNDDMYLLVVDEHGSPVTNMALGTSDYERANDVVRMSDGSFALAGYQGIGGGQDFFLAVYNASYAFEWALPYGTGLGESANAVVETADGEILMVGRTEDGDDARITKVNATTRAEIFSYNYGGAGQESARDVVLMDDGGFAILGSTTTWAEGSDDMWLLRVSSNGTALWNRTYGSVNTDYGFSLVQTPSGGFALAGSQQNDLGFYDMWLVLTDENGLEISNHTYGGIYNEQCFSIDTAYNESGYLLAGYTESFGAGMDDFYYVRINSTGSMIWDVTNGTSRSSRAHSVEALPDGGFILAGYADVAGSGLQVCMNRIWYDTEGPEWYMLPSQVQFDENTEVVFQVVATDPSCVDWYEVNDTRFSISTSGVITNTTALEPGSYPILITAYDKFHNPSGAPLTIGVKGEDVTTTTTTSTTSTTTSPTSSTTTNTTTMNLDELVIGVRYLMIGLGIGGLAGAGFALAGVKMLNRATGVDKSKKATGKSRKD
jgi:hypothetical protein